MPEHISTILERVVEKLSQEEKAHHERSERALSKISCCYGCEPPKRRPGCHDTCEVYQKQKAEWDALRERYNAERSRIADYTAYDVEKNVKRKKKHGR